MICRDHRAVLAGKCRPFRSRAFRLKRHKRQDRLRRSHAHAASDTLGLLTEHGIDLCRRKSHSCSRCYAKELNPAGLSIPASTQLDHPLDPTTSFVRNPRAFGLGCRICGAPDRCEGVSDAGHSIWRSSLRACRTSSRMCPRSAIGRRLRRRRLRRHRRPFPIRTSCQCQA